MCPSSSEKTSRSFELLHPRIKRWIWEKGWQELRDAQERAIPLILGETSDLVLASPTATGKTEAAFLPILTKLLELGDRTGTVLYIGPLKALINDQWGRLELLCEDLGIKVTPWHGDISPARKKDFLATGEGIVLITPESLESLFVHKGSQIPFLFSRLRYVVVDELHAFIGTERGKQLQSLLHRVEYAITRRIPRIGLSATLGDLGLAAAFLRPSDSGAVALILAIEGPSSLRLSIKGIREGEREAAQAQGEATSSQRTIAEDLFRTLLGSSNLVFPNSRQNVELYADLLRELCAVHRVPNEFWPHHGSLSKELREELELALKERERPATAIATNTLELGIDIGSIKSVAQIGPPPSVASLRQRLGRSGRRAGESAILRAYCVEEELSARSGISDRLREGLLQCLATVQLLLDGWCEPPRCEGLHASTLVMQILSIIAERGGETPSGLWQVLMKDGPFENVGKADFLGLLKGLGDKKLVEQVQGGVLLLGQVGEELVAKHDFCLAFSTAEEFRILHEGQVLGSLPMARPLPPHSRIIFAGRRWLVADMDEQEKLIFVTPSPGGLPPSFSGGGFHVHDKVRATMRAFLEADSLPSFLDEDGRRLLGEARFWFKELELGKRSWIPYGHGVFLFPWRGDSVHDALALALCHCGIGSTNEGIGVLAEGSSDEVAEGLLDLASDKALDPLMLLSDARGLLREKWDWALPEGLLMRSYAASLLDFDGAREAAGELSGSLEGG